MEITEKKIKVSDIFKGYVATEDGEDGVFAYDGKLTIRPPYQREFVYDEKKQSEVIRTILNGFPLNTMYWCKTGNDTYEILDGQQRTLSVMQFLNHKSTVTYKEVVYYEDGLPANLREQLENYNFTIYVCEGTEEEKLEWFKIVNIGGEILTAQELRNAVYTGTWLADAKVKFSKKNCVAYQMGSKYIKGSPIRQELLEKALKGITAYQGLSKIEDYMAAHKSDPDADELWQYFQDVIHWIEKIFPNYRKELMSGLDWCDFYNKYHNNKYNATQIEAEIKQLIADDDVTNNAGICRYMLAKGYEGKTASKYLNLRAFSDSDKQKRYAEQDGICPKCSKKFAYDEMAGDHIKPWSLGGRTEYSNLQMLCRDCNSLKGGNY